MTRKRITLIAAGFAAAAVAASIAYAVTRPTYDLLAGGPRPAVGLYWYDNANPTIAPGMTAPLDQLLVRTDTPSLYYKSGASAEAWTLIGQGAGGGGGTVTSVACGTGLSCSPSSPITTSGTVNVSLTTTTCPAGQAEITTAANGTSTCAAFTPAASVSGTLNTMSKFTPSGSALGDSSEVDDGVLFSSPLQIQLGPTAPSSSQHVLIVDNSNTDTANVWTQEGSTSHVGSLGNNEMVSWVARNNTNFDTTAHAGNATILDGIVNCGEAAGAAGVTCTTLAPNATCSTSDCTAYAYNSHFGIMKNDGSVQFGGPARSSPVILGDALQRTTLLPTTPLLTVPQLDLGIIASVDGYNMHIKNTATGVSAMGIVLEGDTTPAASVAPQLVLARGAGGAFTAFGLLCMDNGVASCLAAAAANDMVLANYGTNGSTWIAAKGSVHFGTTAVLATSLTANGHWTQDFANGLPALSAGCNGAGTATIVGNDNRFELNTGTGSVACTITYAKTWTLKPMVTITAAGGIALPTCTWSATAITCTVNTVGDYVFSTEGQPGST